MRRNIVSNAKSLHIVSNGSGRKWRTRDVLFPRRTKKIQIFAARYATTRAFNHSTYAGAPSAPLLCGRMVGKSLTFNGSKQWNATVRRGNTTGAIQKSLDGLDPDFCLAQNIRSVDHSLGSRRKETFDHTAQAPTPGCLRGQLSKLLEPFGGSMSHFVLASSKAIHIVREQLQPESTFEVTPNADVSQWVCSLKLPIPIAGNEDMEAAGTSSEKLDAYNIACRNLLSDLCRVGQFQKLLSEEDFDVLPTKSEWKLEVLDYAAQFLAKANFVTERVHHLDSSSPRDRYRANVSILELQIEASMVSSKPLRAEELACKILIDRLSNESDPSARSRKQLATQTILNCNNAIEFFDFYISKYPETAITLESASPTKEDPETTRKRLLVDGRPYDWANTRTPSHATRAAYLLGALDLCCETPALLEEFHLSNFYTSTSASKPQKELRMSLDEESILIMQDALHHSRNLGLRDEKEAIALDPDQNSLNKHLDSTKKSKLDARSQYLLNRLLKSRENPKYVANLEKSSSLPVMQLQDRVVDHVRGSIFSVVIGQTGSGKTTRVPQIILDQSIKDRVGAGCNIICTQPRRIAATSVAKHVARERCEDIGKTIGYAVRFDFNLPESGGSITYCTTAILLKRLQTDPDTILNEYSHIIIDEVHERNTHQDMLLGLLRIHFATRLSRGLPVPRLTLMSATIFPTTFKEYLENLPHGIRMTCPVLHIPGRTFRVQSYYLDNILSMCGSGDGAANDSKFVRATSASTRRYLELENTLAKEIGENSVHRGDESFIFEGKESDETLVPTDLIVDVIAHIAKTTESGAILVFLPGRAEITEVQENLENLELNVDFRDPSKFKIYTLHSEVFADQQTVFKKSPPNIRKIILSTNLAETSVTIPDVRFVVDSGKVRELHYDQSRHISHLKCTWISKSSAAQRAGRAGRVSDGYYYALYSEARFKSFRSLGIPEILRSDLQTICLDTKAQTLDMPIRQFLSELIEPPKLDVVTEAINTLKGLQALTDDENITALGRLLFNLPLRPYLGKMVVLGVIFRCLEPLVVLAIALEEGRIMYDPVGTRQAAAAARQELADGSSSDHILRINAILRLRRIRDEKGIKAAKQYALEHFIDYNIFDSILKAAAGIEKTLVDANLIRPNYSSNRAAGQIGDAFVNANSTDYNMVRALAFAVTYPNIGVCNGERWYVRDSKTKAIIHPTSVNQSTSPGRRKVFEVGTPLRQSVCFFDTMSVTLDECSLFLRDTSLCSPLLTILFGGPVKAVQLADNRAKISVGDWLTWHVEIDDFTTKVVIEFRKALDRLLVQSYEDLACRHKEKFYKGPNTNIGERFVDSELRSTFTTAIIELLKRDKWIPSVSLSPPKRSAEALL